MTQPAFSIVPCKCTMWAAYGISDRDRRTGHHVECGATSDDRGPGPYRSSARTARSAAIEADAPEERAAVARKLAAGRSVGQHGGPATDGERRAYFRASDTVHCPILRDVPQTEPSAWQQGYQARWAGYGTGACPDCAPHLRAAWIEGWHAGNAAWSRGRATRLV